VAQPKDPDAMLWPTDWSRDGRFILCVQGEIIARNRGEIWVLPVSADRKPRVFIRAPGAAYDGQFSPDGRWAAYVSRESGREEVYVVSFDGNQVSNTPPFEQVTITKRWQVSANGGAYPRWRRDGKELFYVPPGDEFVSVGAETKGNTFLLSETRPLWNRCSRGVPLRRKSRWPAFPGQHLRGRNRSIASYPGRELEGIAKEQIRQNRRQRFSVWLGTRPDLGTRGAVSPVCTMKTILL
jgi:hypothetical protein